MILSQAAKYALRAMVYIAESGSDSPLRVDDIAEALSLPRNYLSKILQTLTRSDLLNSARGPGGGFSLECSPKTTSISDVIELFDSKEALEGCFLGRPKCGDGEQCAAHGQWGRIKPQILTFFAETMLDDLKRPGAALPAPRARRKASSVPMARKPWISGIG